MASMEFIQKRVAGKEKELEKLSKKLERIRKAEAGGWKINNPYGYSEYDLKYTLQDIGEAQRMLDDYKVQLVVENEKANSRNVKVILDFLELWKERVREYYAAGFNEYYAERAAVQETEKVCSALAWGTPEYEAAREKADALRKVFYINCHGEYEERDSFDYRGRKRPWKDKVKISEGKYEHLYPFARESTFADAMVQLEKYLAEEANRKYDFIIDRTNAIVGTITDAVGLKIGAKQGLNGIIVGTRGTARVKTIGAGGCNIQCFHFRTLISEVK